MEFPADATRTWTLDGVAVTASGASPRCPYGAEQIVHQPSVVGTLAAGDQVVVTGEQAKLNYEDYTVDVAWVRGCDEDTPTVVGTQRAYDVTSADVGHRLQARVSYVSAATSGPLLMTTPCDDAALVGKAPAPAVVDHVVGVPWVGTQLSLAGGSWSGADPITETVRWETCDAVCRDAGDGATYTPSSSDTGRWVRAVVTATSAYGRTSVTTAPVGPIAPAPSGTGRVDPATLAFSAPVGTTAPTQLVTYTNGSNFARRLARVSLSGPGFVLAGGDCAPRVTLDPGESCTVGVAFAPAAEGAVTGSLVVDDGVAHSIALTGAGGPPGSAWLSTDSLEFSGAVGTTTERQLVTYTNDTHVARSVTAVTLTGPGFVRDGGDCYARVVVDPGDTCTVGVAFAPDRQGASSGQLLIDDGTAHVVSLDGTGEPGGLLEVSDRAVAFGAVRVGGRSTARIVRLLNPGTEAISITAVELGGRQPGDFVLLSDCAGTEVAPGATCALRVAMTPHGTGARSATLTVSSTAPDGVRSVRLRGHGRRARGHGARV